MQKSNLGKQDHLDEVRAAMRLGRKAGPEQAELAGQEPGFWLVCRGQRVARDSKDRRQLRRAQEFN